MLNVSVKCVPTGLAAALLFGSLVAALSAQSVPFCTGTLGAFGWQCTTVDATSDTGSASRTAYAADGTLLIAYNQTLTTSGKNAQKHALRYATRSTSGAWTTQTIDSSVGEPSTLVLNPVTGRPAIGYGCLKLAEFTGTAWSLQTVVAERACGDWGTTIAFDPSGSLFAAYSDVKSKKLVFGQRTGSAWSFQTFNQLASYKSLAVGPDGQPSIAFENYGAALMFGRRNSSGAWQFTTVDTVASGGASFISHVNLAYDETGAAAIAYHNGPTVRYARLEAGASAWTIDVAHASPAPNWYLTAVSLTHANGEPVITFQQHNQSTSRYELLVTRKSSSGWVPLSSVESFALSDTLLHLSAAYDSLHGLVGVSYGSRAVQQLRFAEGLTGGGW